MHAQYEHSPPTSSRSITATRRPAFSSRSAAVIPPHPIPMTITSNLSITPPEHRTNLGRLLCA
jgi:hypothetical protein